MENLKYIIETWGCQMNEEDSEKLSGILKSKGYKATENRSEADIIIFNTCAVRENAELKVHGNINLLKLLKEKKPNLILGVCGCMMQQKGVGEKIIKRYPFLDMVFGTHNAYKFPEYLNRVMSNGERIVEIYDSEDGIVEGIPIDRKSDTKAFVTIMYGCNNFCTYCVVPHVRGRERSRKKEDIINEIKDLVSKGYKEITLLGQNVNSYGNDIEDGNTFAKLLIDVSKIDGLLRLKFMTSHPKDLNDEVINAIASHDNICNYIHLPVQGGSNSLLKRMNRKYTREDYIALTKKIREKIPEVGLSTDIIVGFPGETEEEFQETITLCQEVGFDLAFTYLYSKRGNTAAEKMDGHIDEKTKHERFDRLIKVTNNIAIGKNKEYEGRTVEILVEGESKNDASRIMGRTETGKLVNFTGKSKPGDLTMVRITKAHSFSLIGEEA